MEIHLLPRREQWSKLLSRDAVASVHDETARIVSEVFDTVAQNGDAAVREYERKFTGAIRTSLKVSEAEIDEAESLVEVQLREAIAGAAANIASFHSAQVMQPVEVETAPGVMCMQRQLPIDTVGLLCTGRKLTIVLDHIDAGRAGSHSRLPQGDHGNSGRTRRKGESGDTLCCTCGRCH